MDLNEVMSIYTHLGDGPVSLGVIALIYWHFDRRLGLRLGVLLMLGAVLNGLLKLTFAAPRPAWFLADPAPHQRWHSFGMPSGHAQSATVWLLAAHHSRHAALWGAAACYALSMGYSRVVIQAHSWSQVCAGWGVGVCLLLAFSGLERGVGARFERPPPLSLRFDGLLSISLVVVALGVVGVAAALVHSIAPEDTAIWERFADEQGLSLPSPASVRTVVAPLGALIGLLVGARLDFRHSPLAPTSLGGMLRRTVFGLGLLGGAAALFKLGLPEGGEGAFGHALRGLSAVVFGVLITAGVPAALRRLELARAP